MNFIIIISKLVHDAKILIYSYQLKNRGTCPRSHTKNEKNEKFLKNILDIRSAVKMENSRVKFRGWASRGIG